MKIIVLGTGYVGLVTGACLANLGHEVTCIDIDKEKINQLKNGAVPFYEPGLDILIDKSIKAGHLSFSDSLATSLDNAAAIFVAVGTPPKENGEADLSQVLAAAKDIANNLNHYAVIINKSTVPVGTAKRVKNLIEEIYHGDFDVVSNPEFLREGSAMNDFMNPDRIVIGANSDQARQIMEEIYQDFSCPKILTNPETAEMIKYAANSFLATKISFINEIANVCEQVGADVKVVAEGMGLDKRIGPAFLNAGLGYGGSCFPKDVRALYQIAGKQGYPFRLLRAVIEVNNHQRWYFFQKVLKSLGEMKNKSIGVWGLAFKPNTDDVRESIALDIIDRLVEEEAIVKVYDPKASQNARQFLADQVLIAATAEQAAQDADCLLIITEWDEFKNYNLDNLKNLMKTPLIIDGRNIYEPEKIREIGFTYECIGRKC